MRRTTSTIAALLTILIVAHAFPAFAQTLIDDWNFTKSLPYPAAGRAVGYSGHIYFVTGNADETGNTIWDAFVADLESDSGEILAWRVTTAPPYASRALSVSRGVLVGHRWVFPTAEGTLIGELSNDGEITRWYSGPGTETRVHSGRVVVAEGNVIYAFGGTALLGPGSQQLQSTIELATLSDEGVLSEWQTLETTHPLAGLHDKMAAIHDGYLYTFGGEGTSGSMTHSRIVHRAEILQGGSLGNFELIGGLAADDGLLERRPHAGSIQFGDTVHIIAGGVGAYMTNSVETATLAELGRGNAEKHFLSEPLELPDGTPWTISAPATAIVGSHGYVLGGVKGAIGVVTFHDSVAYAYLGPPLPGIDPPIAAFNFAPQPAVAGSPVLFEAVPMGGTPTSVLWYLPDGSVSIGEEVQYTFPGSGQFTITLAVENQAGRDELTRAVDVVADPEVPPTPVRGFTIGSEGRLLDPDSQDFIIKGVNEPHHWYPNRTSEALSDIKFLGANTVRIVLGDGRWWNTGAMAFRESDAVDPSRISQIIESCRDHQLVCILEYHDTTGFPEYSPNDARHGPPAPLSKAVDFWKKLIEGEDAGNPAPDVLTGSEDIVLINIGNEPFGNVTGVNEAWANSTIDAILELRRAGLQHTLVVDAPNWGQDTTRIMLREAPTVLSTVHDELGSAPNTMFSVHMYEDFKNRRTARNYLASFTDSRLPIMIGEFGPRAGDGDALTLNDTSAIMRIAEDLRVGYLAWSWSGNGDDDQELDLVTEFDRDRLTNWGATYFGNLVTTSIASALTSAADTEFRRPSRVRRLTLVLQLRVLERQFASADRAGIVRRLELFARIVDAWMTEDSGAKENILQLIDSLVDRFQ